MSWRAKYNSDFGCSESCISPLIGRKISVTLEHYAHWMGKAESIDILESGRSHIQILHVSIERRGGVTAKCLERIHRSMNHIY